MVKALVNGVLGTFGYQIIRMPRVMPNGIPRDPFAAQQLFLRELGRDRTVIFDVGANKGQSARRYRQLLPEATVYSFEPFPDSVEVLRREFDGDPRVRVVAKAVADRSGRRTFHVNAADPTNSLLPRHSTGRRYYRRDAGPKATIEVETVTLDEIVAAEGIAHIPLLKLDIQGGELLALKGAEGLLRARAVSLIYSETMFVPH